MSKPEKRKIARILRQQGMKIVDIATQLDVQPSTVNKWCKDIELSDKQIANQAYDDPTWDASHNTGRILKRNAEKQRLEYQDAGRQRAKDRNTLHLMASMLYWGEGSKGRNSIRFGNTDPYMLQLFLHFLREEFEVPNKKIHLRILTHSTDEQEWERIKQYWLELFNLPSETKATVALKIGTQSRKNRYPNGICSIEVHSTKLVQQIFGAIQEYANFEKPEWLK